MNNERKIQLKPKYIDLLSYEFSENYINLLFDILQESLNRINKHYILLLKNLVNKVSFLKPEKVNNLKKLENLQENVNNIYEKMITSNSFSEDNH